MSWKYEENPNNYTGIRKVPYDMLWHVVYKWGKTESYDRVTQKEALQIMKKMEKARCGQ